MKFPVDIPIGSNYIPVHFICEILSYSLGYRYYAYLRKRSLDKINDDNRILIFIGAAIGGFLGSHLVGILEQPEYLSRLSIAYIMGNTTIVGGLLGAIIGVELMKHRLGIKTSSGDLMVSPLILAMIIGRTGCFLAGLKDGTYGIESTLPWAINFGDGLYRHPTNLYEIVFWIILWVAIIKIEQKRRFSDGSKFKFFMITYLLFRFFIEFIKPDYFFSFGLSVIQLACLLGLSYYYRVFLNLSNLNKLYLNDA